MPHFTVRAAAAFISFTVGLAAVWLSGLLAPLEAAVAEWLVPTSDISVPARPPAGREECDTQRVYETVLREMFGGDDAGRLLVVRAETADSLFDDGADVVDFEGAERETLADYEALSGVPKLLPPLPGVKARVAFLSADEYEEMMFGRQDVPGGLSFYQRFPGARGYIRLSAVGFNRAGDQAFLYASKSGAGLCGEGWLVLLRKSASGWEIERKEMIWIS